MPSTKEIRIRIKAIGNTAKITKAMEMVAASKMKKAQNEAVKNRPYSEAAFEVLQNLRRSENVSHKYYAVPKKASKNLLVIISSDKGLCGSFNSQIFKRSLEYLKENPESDLITIGKKAQNFFKRLGKNLVATYTNFPVNPRVYDIRPIILSITNGFDKGDYKEIAVCYTDFISTLKQSAAIKKLLPMKIVEETEIKKIEFKFEPQNKEVINYLLPRILESQVYQMFLESSASEQSARMVAMKNATDSANDLIEDLSLTYNSIRQSSITQELAEISAAIT